MMCPGYRNVRIPWRIILRKLPEVKGLLNLILCECKKFKRRQIFILAT